MLNASDFEIYIAHLEQALLPPSRDSLLTLSVIAVIMNSVSLAALGRLTRPLTIFQINLVNLTVSDLMFATCMTATTSVNFYIQTKIPHFQKPRESVDGASALDKTTNVTENATSTAIDKGATNLDSDENTLAGLINLACFERFTTSLMCYFTLLPVMATTSLVYHQLTVVWYPLDLTIKNNKKPTALFVILSYLIPLASYSLGIVIDVVKEPKDGCLPTLMSQSVYLAVSGTVSITTVIAFVGNTVMLALLFYKARKQMTQGPSKIMAEKAFKTCLTIAILWATVFIFWSTGVVAFTMVFSFDLIRSPIHENFNIVHIVAMNLFMLNPLLDPIIYGLRISAVREAYTRMLCCNNPQIGTNIEAPIAIGTLVKRSVESQGTREPCDSFEVENN